MSKRRRIINETDYFVSSTSNYKVSQGVVHGTGLRAAVKDLKIAIEDPRYGKKRARAQVIGYVKK